MAGERKYTRIPPESTGDRVYMIHTAEIRYDNKDTAHTWSIGSMYYLSGGLNSNNDFRIHVHGVIEESNTSGVLAVHYEAIAKHEGYTPEDNQAIRAGSISGDIVAYVNGAPYDVYIPAQNIMGWNNPEYGWNIDRFGAGNVRFSEGPAQLSAFGALRTTESTLLAQYAFNASTLPDEFANTLVGSGTITHDPDWGYVVETVGQDTGALTTHTSNTYHPHVPGASNLFVIGNMIGDTGYPGLVRNWGCFDASEGFMFRLNGTSLGVVHRRTFELGSYEDALESPQDGRSEKFIPQSMWNRDRLDGTGPSGMTLRVERPNTYWIDYQNLAGGAIRWGVFYNGERLICHEMDMGNGGPEGVWASNSIRNPNRPICWSMQRVDGSQGDSEPTRHQYPLGASAYIEGLNVDIMAEADVRGYDDTFTVTENVPRTQGAYYFVSIRPKINVKSSNGITDIDNHSLYQPTGLNMMVRDETNAMIPGELRVFSRCLLKNENWKDVSFTNLQIEEDAIHEGHGPEIFRKAFNGFCDIDWTKVFKTIQNGSIKPNAEKDTARRKQNIASVSDRNGFVYLAVKDNPNGSTTHIFEDRGAIEFAGLTNDGPANLNGNTYYLSIDSGDDAYVYSNLTDFDDDRTCRVLNYSGLSGTLNIGDTVTINGTDTCEIVAFDLEDNEIKVQRRSADIDAYTSTSASTDGGALFTVDSVTLTSGTSGVNNIWPKDHYTVLKALTWATVGGATTSQSNVGTVEGQPPKTPVWTFMWAPFENPIGDTQHRINFNLNWKERLQ